MFIPLADVQEVPFQLSVNNCPGAPTGPDPPKAKAAVADEPPFEEPKKRESKKVAEPVATVKKSLDSVVAAWSDEE